MSKVFETSSDESSTSTDSDSDSSEEPRRKRRKTKKKSKNSKKRSRHEYIESETTSESDKSFVPLEISEEEDNDPNHGTIQKSKLSKPKIKKSAPRQPQARKQKTDILRFRAKKVHTPGSLPISEVKSKDKAPIKASNPAKVAEAGKTASELEPETSAINAVDKSFTSESDKLSTMPPSLKVRSWLEKQKISAKPSQNNSEPNVASVSKSSPKTSEFTKPVHKNKLAAIPAQTSSFSSKPASSKPAPKKSLAIKPAQKTSLLAKKTQKTSLANKPAQKTSLANKPAQKTSLARKPAQKSSLDAKLALNAEYGNKENLPGDHNHLIKPGPSGQFRLGRGSQLLEESGKIPKEKAPRPFAKKLFTIEDIEKQLDLDKTPTRNK